MIVTKVEITLDEHGVLSLEASGSVSEAARRSMTQYDLVLKMLELGKRVVDAESHGGRLVQPAKLSDLPRA